MTIALSFLLALLVSAALVPIFRGAALRLGYVVPAHDPGRHERPKPLFGGIAIAVTLFGCSAVIGAFEALPLLLACSAALFIVGLAGDLFPLHSSAKLVTIIIVAATFLFFDYRLWWSDSLTLDGIVTIFWIVGVVSTFNLLDNMDGLCAGTALIAGTAFMFTVLPLPLDDPLAVEMQYLAVLLGALAGFLIYNVHPASVAMGEAGSLVVGLNMAAMTLQIASGRGSDLLSIIAIPMLVLLIPILDATIVAVYRLTSSPTIVNTRHSHSSHRLVAMGLSERKAVGLLWALAGASGVVAIIVDRNQQISALLAVMFTIAMALCAVYLARVHVQEGADQEKLLAAITPLGFELGYRRRIIEVVLDVLLVSVAYYGAFRLRFEPAGWAENFPYFRQSFPVVLGTQVVSLFFVGAYRGMWRYFSLNDGVTFVKAVVLGVIASQVGLLYLYRFEGYSLQIFGVYGMLLLLLLTGSRASFRLLSEFIQRQRRMGRRLLIYGAGDSGTIAVRSLTSDPQSNYRILGFIDDHAGKRNMRIHGYRVIGGYDHLVGMIMDGQVDAVVLTNDGPAIATLASLCVRHGVTLYRLSIDWREIAAGEVVNAEAVGGLPQSHARVVRFEASHQRAQTGVAGVAPWGAAEHGSARRERSSVAAGQAAPIRVAHVITRLILGGAQENTLYTAVGQHQDSRFDVTLVCGVDEVGEGNMFTQATRAGIRTVVLPSLVREIRPLTDVKAFFELYRFFRRESFTIVHTHSSKAGVVGRLAARAAGVPVVVHTIHGVAFHLFQAAWKNRLYVVLERLCAPLSDRIISVSHLLSEAALKRRIGRREQHTTIFSGIDLDLFLSVRDRLPVAEAKRRAGIPPDAPAVGKIARLFPLKGHEQFLAAAANIARRMPETYFLLVGDGPLRDALLAEASRLGLGDRIVMAGRVAPEAVPEYIQAMDVVVHTSLREGIARVLPQAGAVGKPVVTFDLDGAPEVVRDGVSGYLVPPVDVQGIADRVVQLLRSPNDRLAFGEAGRAFAADHFGIDRMIDRINDVYFDLLRARPAATHDCH